MDSTIVNIVKQAAHGRELEILERVANIPRSFLHTSEGPCPWCGGVTRFRVIDEEDGAVYCSHCFDEKNGDFIAAVQKGREVGFKEAVQMVEEYLGLNKMPAASPTVSEIFISENFSAPDQFA